MKAGDLVRYNYIEDKTIESGKIGIVIEDKTMICKIDADSPYRIGSVMVMWSGKIERELYADLEVISESR